MRKKHNRDYSRKFCTKRSSWRRDPWETSQSKRRRAKDQQEIADQWREMPVEVEEVVAEVDSDPSYEEMGRFSQRELEVEMAWDSRTRSRAGRMIETAYAVRDPDVDFKLFCLDLLQVANETKDEEYDWDDDPDFDAWWG